MKDTDTSRFDAIRKAREWVAVLPQKTSPSPVMVISPAPPRYSAEDLLYLVDPDIRKPFDMGEVVLRLVDDSRISSFKSSFGSNLMTAFAQIYGAIDHVHVRNPLLTFLGRTKGGYYC
jgi:acetyl-CoA carboxylase carboxyltransferase component